MSKIGVALASALPAFPDVLIVGGFGAVVAGLWMSFGLGPTLIAGGAALIWVGGVMYRGVS